MFANVFVPKTVDRAIQLCGGEEGELYESSAKDLPKLCESFAKGCCQACHRTLRSSDSNQIRIRIGRVTALERVFAVLNDCPD